MFTMNINFAKKFFKKNLASTYVDNIPRIDDNPSQFYKIIIPK